MTDQTSAHDPLNGYVPNGMSFEAALELRARDPKTYEQRSLEAMARHVEGMLRLQKMGAVTFDYGNNIRTFAFQQGVKNAYDFPGFVPEYIRPLFCEGKGPFRWVALSGDAQDIAVTDDLVLELFPQNRKLDPLDRSGAQANSLPGIAGAHLLAWLWRARGVRLGDQQTGEAGKDQGSDCDWARSSGLRLGGIALPRNRVDEGRQRRGGRLAAAERAGEYRLGCVVGFHPQRRRRGHWILATRGAGDGGRRQDEMARRIERVLTNDPGMGVMRHVDAGYDEAKSFAKKTGVRIPMREKSKSTRQAMARKKIARSGGTGTGGAAASHLSTGDDERRAGAAARAADARDRSDRKCGGADLRRADCGVGQDYAKCLRNPWLKEHRAEVIELDCRGKVVLPGFVDSHTHPVFVAPRLIDFEKRVAGASYEEIAAAGGGIRAEHRGRARGKRSHPGGPRLLRACGRRSRRERRRWRRSPAMGWTPRRRSKA